MLLIKVEKLHHKTFWHTTIFKGFKDSDRYNLTLFCFVVGVFLSSLFFFFIFWGVGGGAGVGG
jgi:hypothetical protein